jgi:aldose 1-epimerase
MTIELNAPGCRALIEPAFGGRLHQLFVELDGREWPLLRSPEDPAEHGTDPLSGGCYPMAPWPNRIADGLFMWRGERWNVENGREHALHGLVCDRPWEVVARVGRVVEIRCALDDRWPWEGSVWQRIELRPGSLVMKMEVRSAREPFPAGCGWHPWFRRDAGGPGEVCLELPASQRYEMRDQLPTGETVVATGDAVFDGIRPLGDRRLDDCFTGFDAGGAATILWDRLRLEVAFDCAQPHMQVYTPPEGVCLEPQTCAPDAFNLAAEGRTGVGMAVVEPGRPLALSMLWRWREVAAPQRP